MRAPYDGGVVATFDVADAAAIESALAAVDSVRGTVDVLRTQHGTEIPMRLNDASMHRFGDSRTSGLGMGGIPYSVRDTQQEKMLVIRSNEL